MEDFIKWFEEITGLGGDILFKILISLLVVAGLWVIRFLVIRMICKHSDDPRSRYRWSKTISYIYLTFTSIALLRIWFQALKSLDSLFAFLSAGLAAGLAIALQDLIKSFAGWLFIISKKPFQLGDRIEIIRPGDRENIRGDVIDIRAFKFSLVEIGNWVEADQSTGRVMHIPNSYVLSDTIINYGEGFEFIWNEIKVLVTFESNWRDAKSLLTKIANKHSEHITNKAETKIKAASRKYMIFYKNLTPIVYTSVQDCGVLLTIRYLVEPRRRRSTEETYWEDILTEFGLRDDIDFAYPTQRFFDNRIEGKDYLRANLNQTDEV